MMAKIDVNGETAIPLFQWLRSNSSLEGDAIPWNFAKFLLNPKGEILKYYPPEVSPNMVLPDILKLLNAPSEEEEEEVVVAQNDEVKAFLPDITEEISVESQQEVLAEN